jgi:hypothetical protein
VETIPCGDCFRFANNLAREMLGDGIITEDKIRVCHGTVIAPFSRDQKRYEHAWVEIDEPGHERVHDWQMRMSGKGSLPKVDFYELFQPQGVKRYAPHEAMINQLKHRHHGPWESVNFKNWLQLTEGGKGSGTKFSGTGLGAGGQAQGGMGMSKPAPPQKQATNPEPSAMSPRDWVPKGWKPQPGPGAKNYMHPVPPRKPGFLGGGKSLPGPLEGGPFGGGGIGVATKKNLPGPTPGPMKKSMKK